MLPTGRGGRSEGSAGVIATVSCWAVTWERQCPTVAGQLVLGRIRHRVRVGAHVTTAESILARSDHIRYSEPAKTQADGQQQNERQSAKPTSNFHVCYRAAKLRHRRASEPLSPVNFKAGVRPIGDEYYNKDGKFL